VYFSDVDAGDTRALIEYLDHVARVSADDKHKTFATQNLAPGMHVLDVGCGTGDDVRAIAEIVGPEGRVAGIDPSRALIHEATARGVPPNAQFELASADALPFDDATFDAVRAERVFQHLAERECAARELKRVLKPGGTALLLDQDWGSLIISGADRPTTERIVRALIDHHTNAWAGREAPGLLRRAGFSGVSVAPLVAAPILPVAFKTILNPAIDAALHAGSIDAETAATWLRTLLEADARGEFFCAVVVTIALGIA
jgi:ubiquinone/menaquinone biosynthesis C-methylase UbiE